MYEELPSREAKNEEQSERGVAGEVGRHLPRLFSEMATAPAGTGEAAEAGAVGGREGVGDEGGAPREEVWDVLSPVEATEVEGGRALRNLSTSLRHRPSTFTVPSLL